MVVLCLHLKEEEIMESELKYRIKDREMADTLWDDECLLAIADPSSREKLVMKAVYFDTEDHVLSGSNMALDRKSTRLNSSHSQQSRMPSSA